MENLTLTAKIKENKTKALSLESGPGGHLWVKQGSEKTLTTVKACFPWSHPMSHFSLRDKKDKEVALIEDMGQLNSSSQQVLQKALEEAGFCFVIRNLLKTEEDYELRMWFVETEQGPRQFQTKLMDWPREVPGGGLIIQDLAGDIYFVANVEELPEPGKTLLWAFLD